MSCGYSYRMINTVDKERFQQTFAMSAKKYFSKEDYVRETLQLTLQNVLFAIDC